MNENRRAKGASGEQIAADFLCRKGYTVLCRNFTVRGGELDIVALCGDFLCFVEVKTRKNTRFGTGCEAVDARKIARLTCAAERFLYDHRDDAALRDKTIRFDVIEIYMQSRTIRHIKGIDL